MFMLDSFELSLRMISIDTGERRVFDGAPQRVQYILRCLGHGRLRGWGRAGRVFKHPTGPYDHATSLMGTTLLAGSRPSRIAIKCVAQAVVAMRVCRAYPARL